MTQDERTMLTDLANKVAQTPPPPRDPEAEEFIRTQIGKRPDALYLMAQTVLIQNLALEQAKRQIQELQARAGQSQSGSSGSFLGQQSGGAGYSQPSGQTYSGNFGAPQPGYAQASSAPQPGTGAPSFLRGAAQTAAGVAAGALAFEGIRSMFSHPGYGMGGGGYGMGGFGGGGGPMEETVVNNYYDNPGGAGGGADNSNLDLSDNRDLADTGTDDLGQYDDASVDDVSDLDTGDGGSDDNFA